MTATEAIAVLSRHIEKAQGSLSRLQKRRIIIDDQIVFFQNELVALRAKLEDQKVELGKELGVI